MDAEFAKLCAEVQSLEKTVSARKAPAKPRKPKIAVQTIRRAAPTASTVPKPEESRPVHVKTGSNSLFMNLGQGGGAVLMPKSFEKQPQFFSFRKAEGKQSEVAKKKRCRRVEGGKVWEDPSLADWPESRRLRLAVCNACADDFRLFVGDIGNECTDDMLAAAFSKYSSFAMARVVKDTRSGKGKGFGFVSFLDGLECAKALREMNGKYVGHRPMKLKKSDITEQRLKSRRTGNKRRRIEKKKKNRETDRVGF